MDWQPIESVPRGTGDRVLVWDARYQQCEFAQVANDGTCWFGDWDGTIEASHWMPLPDAPSPLQPMRKT